MPRRGYKPEEIVAKLRQVDVLVSQGQNMADAIRPDRRERGDFLSVATGVRRAVDAGINNSPQKCRLKIPQVIVPLLPRAGPGEERRIATQSRSARMRGRGAVIKLGELMVILDLHREGLYDKCCRLGRYRATHAAA
jgi:hypothetical protein